MSLSCAICGGACKPFLADLYDDRYGFPGHFDLQECGDCGHRQLAARFSDAELVRLYSDYYPRSAVPAAEFVPYGETAGLRSWLDGDRSGAFRWVPPKVRVLDIGSGAGRALAYHHARGCDAWGVEADENARAVAALHGLNLRVGTFHPSMFEAGSFDYLTLDQVIEHAVDPVEFMRGAASLLKGGGRAVLSTPNSRSTAARLFGKRWLNWHVPYHLHQFSRASLRELARKAGLDVETLRTLTPSTWLRYQWLHIATLPAPGQSSAYWDPARGWDSVPRATQRAVVLAQDLRLYHLATRAADALGVGENFLCVLRKPA